MRTTVVDASAVLAFLFDEPGAETLEALLHQAAEADKPLLITAANWTEVLCHMQRKRGEEGVTSARSFLRREARWTTAELPISSWRSLSSERTTLSLMPPRGEMRRTFARLLWERTASTASRIR